MGVLGSGVAVDAAAVAMVVFASRWSGVLRGQGGSARRSDTRNVEDAYTYRLSQVEEMIRRSDWTRTRKGRGALLTAQTVCA
jgi:hypothetical protein